MTGPVGVIGVPQEFDTVGGVGTVCAFDAQGTVDPDPAGTVKVGGEMV
jgi:hypothetical protein